MNKEQLNYYSLEQLSAAFPENFPLCKDGGLWSLFNDEMTEPLIQQDLNETFKDFIIRCLMFDPIGLEDNIWRTALKN